MVMRSFICVLLRGQLELHLRRSCRTGGGHVSIWILTVRAVVLANGVREAQIASAPV
jgi:hypothetical protein